jgi:hypothetical protein
MVACGRRRACVQFFFGSLVKWASSYSDLFLIAAYVDHSVRKRAFSPPENHWLRVSSYPDKSGGAGDNDILLASL